MDTTFAIACSFSFKFSFYLWSLHPSCQPDGTDKKSGLHAEYPGIIPSYFSNCKNFLKNRRLSLGFSHFFLVLPKNGCSLFRVKVAFLLFNKGFLKFSVAKMSKILIIWKVCYWGLFRPPPFSEPAARAALSARISWRGKSLSMRMISSPTCLMQSQGM